MLLLFLCQAFAQDEEDTSTSKWMSEPRMRFMVSGEQWKDPFIGSIYKSSHMYPMIGGSYRFHQNMSLDLDTGVYRLEGNQGATEFRSVPLFIGGSLLAAGSSDKVEPFVGVGATLVSFAEDTPVDIVSGTKLGTEVRAGVRIGTKYIDPFVYPESQYGPNPSSESSVKQLDIEVVFAQRIHHAFGIGTGFDLGAFRFGVGLQLRL